MSTCTPRAWPSAGVRIGKSGSDHEQCVAILHQIPGWLGSEKADRAGDPRQVVWKGSLSKKGFCRTCLQAVGNGDHRVGCVQCAGADQNRHLFTGVQDVSGGLKIVTMREDAWTAVARS